MAYNQAYYEENKDRLLAQSRKWRECNKERHLARAREYHHANKEKLRPKRREYAARTKERRAHLLRLKKYGISAEQFSDLMTEQNGLCAMCYSNPAVVVDHNHETKVVRGILCNQCNTALGLMKEDTRLLWLAIEYIVHHKRQASPARSNPEHKAA